MPELRLHNFVTKRRETLVPIEPGHVRVYCCGPTVYDLAHIGNARPAVIYDVLARLLRLLFPRKIAKGFVRRYRLSKRNRRDQTN